MANIDIKPDSQGKVRDMATWATACWWLPPTHISACDYILPDEIRNKGKVLNQLSVFWFDLLKDVIENHRPTPTGRGRPA